MPVCHVRCAQVYPEMTLIICRWVELIMDVLFMCDLALNLLISALFSLWRVHCVWCRWDPISIGLWWAKVRDERHNISFAIIPSCTRVAQLHTCTWRARTREKNNTWR